MSSAIAFVSLLLLLHPHVVASTCDVNAQVGERIIIHCKIAGTVVWPEWLKDALITIANQGVSLINPDYSTRFSYAADMRSLIVDPVQLGDTGSYVCSHIGGHNSPQTTSVCIRALLLLPHPSVVATTSHVVGVEGGTISIPCKITGTYTYPEWMKDATIILAHQNSYLIHPNYPRLSYAADQKTLIVSSAQLEDAGSYVCSHSRGHNSPQTTFVNVIEASTGDVNAKSGERILIPCKITGTYVLPEWMKDAAITITNEGASTINPTYSARFSYDSDQRTLIVDPVQLSDTGSYVCSHNGGDNSPQTTSVCIGASTGDVNAKSGERILIPCKITGTFVFPEWVKDTIITIANQGASSINPAYSARFSYDSDQRTLIVDPVQLSDTGSYVCSHIGGHNSPQTTSVFVVNVEASTGDVNAQVGDRILIPCKITGTYVLPEWVKDAAITIANQGAPTINPAYSARFSYDSDQRTLIVDPVLLSDTGSYVCSHNGEDNSPQTTSVCIGALLLLPHPSVVATTGHVAGVVGDTISIPCMITGTYTLPEWVKDETIMLAYQAIPSINPNYPRVSYASDQKTLIVSSVQLEDAGSYVCSQSGGHNSPQTTFVTVIEGGHIIGRTP